MMLLEFLLFVLVVRGVIKPSKIFSPILLMIPMHQKRSQIATVAMKTQAP
jgi:hypothetical protein